MKTKLTKKRQEILHLLQKHHGTLSAAELHKHLPHMDLATIYRSLDLFVKEKLIKRIPLDTEEAQYEYQHEAHHHAICTYCKKVFHFTAEDTKIKKLLGLKKFDIDNVEVIVHGSCKDGVHTRST